MKKIKQNNDMSDRWEEGFFEKRMDGQGRREDVIFVWNDVKEHAARRAGESMFRGRENTAASNNRRQASAERAVNEEERVKRWSQAGFKPSVANSRAGAFSTTFLIPVHTVCTYRPRQSQNNFFSCEQTRIESRTSQINSKSATEWQNGIYLIER